MARVRRVFPRILLFAGLTAGLIVVVVNELPGLLLGAVGLGWIGALFTLVAATQGGGVATEDGASGGDGADDGPSGPAGGGSDGGDGGGSDGD